MVNITYPIVNSRTNSRTNSHINSRIDPLINSRINPRINQMIQCRAIATELFSNASNIMSHSLREHVTIEQCYSLSVNNNGIANVEEVALETFRNYLYESNYIRMVDTLATFLQYAQSGKNALLSMHYEQVYAVCMDELITMLRRAMYQRVQEEAPPLVDVKCVMAKSCIDIHHPKSVHNRCGGEDGCVVCLDEIAIGDEKRTLTTCGHIFHAECIDTWLTGESNKCPLCRVSAGLSHPDHEVDN
jgi:hypothetical protein